jgi:hypothetical protein
MNWRPITNNPNLRMTDRHLTPALSPIEAERVNHVALGTLVSARIPALVQEASARSLWGILA